MWPSPSPTSHKDFPANAAPSDAERGEMHVWKRRLMFRIDNRAWMEMIPLLSVLDSSAIFPKIYMVAVHCQQTKTNIITFGGTFLHYPLQPPI